MQTNLMQCAAYGLSTDRLSPHPFNLCSNAGNAHTSISQTQPLVLSGTCPVKPLYGLGHCAAAQFHCLGNLYVEQQFFFSYPQRVICQEVPC